MHNLELFAHEQIYTGKRLANDYYPTPPHFVDTLLHYSDIITSGVP